MCGAYHCYIFRQQVPLTWEDWTNVLSWALPILLVDEILKAIGRYVNRQKIDERYAATVTSIASIATIIGAVVAGIGYIKRINW